MLSRMDYGETAPTKEFLAGGFGGVCLVITGHPFDTVKVRLQTMRPSLKKNKKPMYAGTLDCAKKILVKEGLSGFYKGMGTPLLTVVPIYAISFYGFHIGKAMQHKLTEDRKYCYECFFWTGIVTGILTTVIATPTDRIKCLLQIQQENRRYMYSNPISFAAEVYKKGGLVGIYKATADSQKYSSPLDCALKLYNEGGIRSIYRGAGATLLRNIPASEAYFFSYEWVHDLLTPKGSKRELSPLRTILAGGIAGIMHWFVIMPADVIKTRLQAAPNDQYPKGIRSVFTELMKEEGWRAFYKGFVPVLLRAFPANAICFLGYEVAREYFF